MAVTRSTAGPSSVSSSSPSTSRRPVLPPLSTSTSNTPASLSAGPEASPRLLDEPVSARSGAAANASTSAASSSFAGGASAHDDIEMEPIKTGHRRRKSSLMSPSGAAPPPAGRPRSQSLRAARLNPHSPIAGSSVNEEPKIAEEGAFLVSPTTSKHEHDHDSDAYSDQDLRDDEETGLTDKEKRRKQKKRRRNTLLDQRIAREKDVPADREDTDKNIVKRIAINIGLILLWYIFSLCISLVSSKGLF